MCKRRSQVRHVGEEKGSPAQGAGAKHNACAVPKIEKGCKKGESNLQPWDVGKREARTNVNTMC